MTCSMLTKNADLKRETTCIKFFLYAEIFLVSRGSPRETNNTESIKKLNLGHKQQYCLNSLRPILPHLICKFDVEDLGTEEEEQCQQAQQNSHNATVASSNVVVTLT